MIEEKDSQNTMEKNLVFTILNFPLIKVKLYSSTQLGKRVLRLRWVLLKNGKLNEKYLTFKKIF